MIPPAVLILLAVVTLLLAVHISQRTNSTYKRALKMFPGPDPLPLIGNWLMLTSSQAVYSTMVGLSKKYKRFGRLFAGGMPFIVLYHYKDFETVLHPTVKLRKNRIYGLLEPWLGTGLLTSYGDKWKSRRRILTPAFHFKVLQTYFEVFNENGTILCNKLAQYSGKGTFDVAPIIQLYALDNIYETAMKTKVNALKSADSTYVRAIKDIAAAITFRSFNLLLQNDFLFNRTKYGKIHQNALNILHGTTRQIIKDRRRELAEEKEVEEPEETSDIYGKKRLVFLDILLSSKEGAALSDEDIAEEVNTFMFEGHDTVSSGISFTLYALAHNPSVQERAYQEQISIFGDDDRQATNADIQEMKYLDIVLKESQRLYPSVPLMGRHIHEDIPLSDGYVLPKGCQITLLISRLHRDPDVWPEPDKFDPDRFLPDVASTRSPHAYVPFSAGERNCIGQRFALLEMKSCVSKVLRRFELLPSPDKEDEVNLYAELVLVSSNGVKIQVRERK